MNCQINCAIRLSLRSFAFLSPKIVSNDKNINYIPKHNFSSVAEVGGKAYFDDIVSKNKIVIFIKGTPDAPKCGFSNAVVQIMRMHGVESYDSYNVLDDDKVRQGIKSYSEWPTIPQVFINGEFVGGCDILIQLHQNGDLIEKLQTIGIQSAVLTEALKKNTKKDT